MFADCFCDVDRKVWPEKPAVPVLFTLELLLEVWLYLNISRNAFFHSFEEVGADQNSVNSDSQMLCRDLYTVIFRDADENSKNQFFSLRSC